MRYSPEASVTWLSKSVAPSLRAISSLRCVERFRAAVKRSKVVAVEAGLSGDSG